MRKIIIILYIALITGCTTTGAGAVLALPDAPPAPSIEHPEKMVESDKRALAEFYRMYELYKEKIKAWKKRFS